MRTDRFRSEGQRPASSGRMIVGLRIPRVDGIIQPRRAITRNDRRIQNRTEISRHWIPKTGSSESGRSSFRRRARQASASARAAKAAIPAIQIRANPCGHDVRPRRPERIDGFSPEDPGGRCSTSPGSGSRLRRFPSRSSVETVRFRDRSSARERMFRASARARIWIDKSHLPDRAEKRGNASNERTAAVQMRCRWAAEARLPAEWRRNARARRRLPLIVRPAMKGNQIRLKEWKISMSFSFFSGLGNQRFQAVEIPFRKFRAFQEGGQEAFRGIAEKRLF